MKTTIILTILTLFAVSSCSDRDSLTVTPLIPSSSALTASIDGLKWEADSAEASRLGHVLVVQGRTRSPADGHNLTITLISNDWRLGEHGMGTLGVSAIVNQVSGEETFIRTAEEIGSGSIVVTKNDRKGVAGRFSFTAKTSEGDDPISVADGVFDVKIDIRDLPDGAITEDAKLLAEDGIRSDLYGVSLAIDGGVIAIAASGHSRGDSGEEAVYLVNSYSGEQLSKLVPDDLNSEIGSTLSIAIGEGVVAVGLANHKNGSVTLFDVQSGRETHVLTADSAEEYPFFGRGVAIDRGLVAVAAHASNNHGIIFLYDVHSGLLVKEIAISNTGPHFGAGGPLAMSDGIIAVGKWVIMEDGQYRTAVAILDVESGSERHVYKVDDLLARSNFGAAVAISGSEIAITAPIYSAAGAAYIFDLNTGAQLQKIELSESEGIGFGRSVSFDSGLVAVGASRFRSGPSDHNTGTVYVFDATSGQLIVQLLASDGLGNGELGTSVAIEDGRVFAGAIGDDEKGDGAGAVYRYNLQ